MTTPTPSPPIHTPSPPPDSVPMKYPTPFFDVGNRPPPPPSRWWCDDETKIERERR
ncbi:hypothetical protein Hanom_Chr04g00344501 [Helianthus anomalus]